MTRVFLILALCSILSACAPAAAVPITTSKLRLPSDRLMAAPKKLPPVAAGDSIYADDVQCHAEYGKLSDTVVGLQNYVHVVTKR